jgi:regulator of cell morphogenesis and NO signaling
MNPMTTTTAATLADVAATSLGAVRTLERYGLDYCCGGKRPFEQACAAKGLNPELVLEEINNTEKAGDAARDWQTAPLVELINHIVVTHHEYLKAELPALRKRIDKVVSVHGSRDPETLNRMSAVFGALSEELLMHLHKEEAILFPVIGEYAAAEAQGRPVPPVPFGTVAHPIAMMEREHEGAGGALEELRHLTRNYEPPAYACSTVRALYEGLQALEADLHVHIHLENNILFPRAIALEAR